MNLSCASVSSASWLIVMFLSVVSSVAQEWTWARQDGSLCREQSTGVAVDSLGNVYTVGWFEGMASIGEQNLTVSGHQDAFIARWTPEGQAVWVCQGGGRDDDMGAAITVDPLDHIIAMGRFRSTNATFDLITITNKYARDNNSLWLAKLSPQGKAEWVQQAGGASTLERAAVDTDALGNIYLVACMARFAHFGNTNLSGYEDILLAKYDPQGHLLWATKAGGNGYDYGLDLAATSAGFTYVTGYFEKDAPFGHITLTSRGLTDVFLAKYDPEGQVIWAVQAGGSSQDQDSRLAVDSLGGIYLAGWFAGKISIGPHELAANGSALSRDLFLARFDPEGNSLWAKSIGDAETESIGDLIVNVTTNNAQSHTNLFLSGHFVNKTSVNSVILTNTTAQRMFVSRWDCDGQLCWVRQAGGETSELALDNRPIPNLYVAGGFVDPSAWADTFLASPGNSQAFLSRLDTSVAEKPVSLPRVVTPPLSQVRPAGSIALFSVTLSGHAPISLQWQKDGQRLFNANRFNGTSTPTLSLNSVQTNDAGSYRVIISNPAGSITSQVAVLTVAPATISSGPQWEWVRMLGGAKTDANAAVAVNSQGGIVVAGTFQETNIIGETALIAAPSARNVFVAQFNAQGLPVWARQSVSPKTDTCSDAAFDGQGNVFVTGYYSASNLVFGIHTLTNQAPNDDDCFLVKYSPDGTESWVFGWGGQRDDSCRNLAIDSQGYCLLAGDFSSPVLYLGNHVVTNVGGTDVYLAKVSPQGQAVWVKTAGLSGSHEGNSVAVDANDHIYFTGKYWGRIQFGDAELDSHFDHDSFLAKYDQHGQLLWVRALNSLDVTVIRDLSVDAQGDLIAVGYFNQSCSLDEIPLISRGGSDVFLAKFSPGGRVLWAKAFGGPGLDYPSRVLAMPDRSIVLAGEFQNVADFGGLSLASGGQRNAFVSAVSSDGNVIWAKQMGGTRSDSSLGLAGTATGQLWISGSCNSTVWFDGSSYITANNSVDGFLAQLQTLPTQPSLSLSIDPRTLVLEIRGTVGKTLILQSASRLAQPTTWTSLTNFVLSQSPTFWQDPAGSQSNQRFYRAIIQP